MTRALQAMIMTRTTKRPRDLLTEAYERFGPQVYRYIAVLLGDGQKAVENASLPLVSCPANTFT